MSPVTTSVTAVFTVRGEPDWFVADMMANLPWVDRFVALTVPDDGPWLHEGEQNARKRELLWSEIGEGWTLWVDPDERLDDCAADVVPHWIGGARSHLDTVFGFPLREMWTPTAYRVDGPWDNKLPRHRLFYLKRPGWQVFANRPIHCPAAPSGTKRQRVVLPVDMYHLKNIEPENRAQRALAYARADPGWEFQRPHNPDDPSWAWLHDAGGAVLTEIPAGRGFSPPYAQPYHFVAPPSA